MTGECGTGDEIVAHAGKTEGLTPAYEAGAPDVEPGGC